MKTNSIITALAILLSLAAWAQDRTTVTATTDDISDNLDLRAVASLFGDAENLEQFERMLNDPRKKISNLDLNGDNQVDYLRVVESVEERTHLILIQAVLDRDVYQDVATVEVERDRNNRVQVQVVGDVFMYGPNYIYEPVYSYTPVIYNTFWVRHYRPYWSTWHWGYYPSWYYAWHPIPVYNYCNNVAVYVNHNHYYHYGHGRRSSRAVAMHNGIRANGYHTHYNGRAFEQRASVKNRRELDQVRTASGTRTANTGAVQANSGTHTSQTSATRSTSTLSAGSNHASGTRTSAVIPASTQTSGTRTSSAQTVNQPAPSRSVTVETPVRSSIRSTTPTRAEAPRAQAAPRRETTSPTRSYRSAASTPSTYTGVRQSTPTPAVRPAANSGSYRQAVPRTAAPTRMAPPRQTDSAARSSMRR